MLCGRLAISFNCARISDIANARSSTVALLPSFWALETPPAAVSRELFTMLDKVGFGLFPKKPSLKFEKLKSSLLIPFGKNHTKGERLAVFDVTGARNRSSTTNNRWKISFWHQLHSQYPSCMNHEAPSINSIDLRILVVGYMSFNCTPSMAEVKCNHFYYERSNMATH